jgi:hypothetical protein
VAFLQELLAMFGIKTKFTDEQRLVLTKFFEQNKYPSTSEKHDIALRAGISDSQVSVWFMHERRRSKQKVNRSTNAYI